MLKKKSEIKFVQNNKYLFVNEYFVKKDIVYSQNRPRRRKQILFC